ncbi:alpha/beta hydrolase [Demequina sp.]|uniref:alpha/beta fold hydrolase n=1 Tax=Demequina sp. TaxID=2050685 RepID=UPI00344E3AB0
MGRCSRPSPGEWAIADAVDVNYDDVADRLPRLEVPVTLLHGDADRIVGPRSSEPLRDVTPGSTLETVEGAGHSSHLTRPDGVNRVILNTAADVRDSRP